MKAIEHDERIVSRRSCGRPHDDPGRPRHQVRCEQVGFRVSGEREIDGAHRLARPRIGRIGGDVQDVGKVQARFEAVRREPHRIGRRFVNTGDAELTPSCTAGVHGQCHDVADGKPGACRQLPRDENGRRIR